MNIQDMKTNDELLIKYLKDDIKRLKAENVVAIADERIIKTLGDEVRELKAELRKQKKGHLQASKGRIDLINELKAENESLQDQLKECVSDYDNDIKASYDLDDKHIEIIKRLEVEKDALLVANGELLQSNLRLRENNGVKEKGTK